MALPQFSMRELIEAGVHFGHKTRRWNPKMSPFIYGERNNIHIIDLQKTVPLLNRALKAMQESSARNGRILFVGTKRQASDLVKEAAERCGQYYVNERWLGGMLTNWKTIQNSIRQLKKLEEQLANEESLNLTKKEILKLQRQHDKLQSSLGGIRDMSGLPSMIFIIDVIREELAVKEANKLGIPVVAIVDSNADLNGIDYPIPGNDDAIRAIRMYCKLTSDAVLSGIEASLANEIDMGAQAEPEVVEEEVVVEAPKAAEPKTKSSTKKEAMAEVAKKKSEDKADAAPKEEKAAKKPAAKKAPAKKDADAKEEKAEKKAPAKKAAAKKPAAKKAPAKKDADKAAS